MFRMVVLVSVNGDPNPTRLPAEKHGRDHAQRRWAQLCNRLPYRRLAVPNGTLRAWNTSAEQDGRASSPGSAHLPPIRGSPWPEGLRSAEAATTESSSHPRRSETIGRET